MIVEIIVSTAGGYIIDAYQKRTFTKYKKEFDKIIDRIPGLKNNQGEKPELINYNPEEYGYKIKFFLPVGITTKKLQEHLLDLKQALKLSYTHFNFDSRLITLYGIKDYKFKRFLPYKLPPNEILVGEFIGNCIIVDMNKYPHALIAGDTGTGKSRLLFTILTNLIHNSNRINLYLLQVRKNDLVLFKNCRQVKICSRTLSEVLEALQEINLELIKREQLLDIEKGYLNITDYNKKSGRILKYIYVIIEEFSFLNISRADSKEEKQLKAECMKHIKSIVNVGRSSGVFLLTSLQKPTADSIPSDIKAQLTTRISLLIKDESTCKVVLGDGSATELGEREFVCKTKVSETGYSYTINFDEIKEYTKASQVIKQKINTPAKAKIKATSDDILRELGL